MTTCGEDRTVGAKYFDVVHAILHNQIGGGDLGFGSLAYTLSYNENRVCTVLPAVQESAGKC